MLGRLEFCEPTPRICEFLTYNRCFSEIIAHKPRFMRFQPHHTPPVYINERLSYQQVQIISETRLVNGPWLAWINTVADVLDNLCIEKCMQHWLEHSASDKICSGNIWNTDMYNFYDGTISKYIFLGYSKIRERPASKTNRGRGFPRKNRDEYMRFFFRIFQEQNIRLIFIDLLPVRLGNPIVYAES